jgi:hypothetical protein
MYFALFSLHATESKVGSTDFLPATLSLISQGSLALKLNNEQNVINGKAGKINPGPSVASESSSSVSSAESLLSNMSNLMTNSVSFLHLNIQSIVPKLDFIVAI